MRYRILLVCLSLTIACVSSKVDPGLVGTWELTVPNTDGVARWVWDIHADGTYGFHAEGPGNVPSHSGLFEAKNGKYTLRSTTMVWTDDGTYQLIGGNTLSAAGKLGSATWTRVAAPNSPPPVAAVDTGSPKAPPTPDGGAGLYSADAIYSFLAHHRFDDRILAEPLTVARSETVDPDRQEKNDGIIGIVRTEVGGMPGAATISFVVYRDRTAADAARDLDVIFDAKSFRSKPGEMVSSHAYTYHERGEARCLSRLMIGSSSTATVTCYLLVQYPTRDPVMIESELTEQVAAGQQEASAQAIERADDLLFAGIKEWALVYPEIGRM